MRAGKEEEIGKKKTQKRTGERNFIWSQGWPRVRQRVVRRGEKERKGSLPVRRTHHGKKVGGTVRSPPYLQEGGNAKKNPMACTSGKMEKLIIGKGGRTIPLETNSKKKLQHYPRRRRTHPPSTKRKGTESRTWTGEGPPSSWRRKIRGG